MKYLIVVIFLVLFSCGGGGGSSSSTQAQSAAAPTSNTSSSSSSSSTSSSTISSTNYKVILQSVKLNSDDVIAQLSQGNTTSSNFNNFYKNFLGPFKDLVNIFLPALVAQNSLNPVDLSAWNRISKKLENGTITDIQTTYKIAKTDESGQIIYKSEQGFDCIVDPKTGVFTSLINTSTNQTVESYSIDERTNQPLPAYSDEARSCDIVEVSIECDTSELPIHILESRVSDEKNKDLIAKIEYVSSFNIDASSGSDSAICIPVKSTGLILVQNEKVYNISDACIRDFHLFKAGLGTIDELTRWWSMDYFVPANSAFNTSNKPIISRTCDPNPNGNINNQAAVLNTMEINEYGNLLIKPLTTEMSIHGGSGKIAFDGTYLFTISNDRQASTIYKHKVGESGFTIVTPEVVDYNDENTFSSVGSHLGVFFQGKAFEPYKGRYDRFVFFKDELYLFGGPGAWAHKYNKATDEITLLLDAWPRIILVDGSYPGRDLSHCPDGASNETELSKDGMTDCMEMPRAYLRNDLGEQSGNILGVWNENIIFDDIGSWSPSSLLHSGHIICLPRLPNCASSSEPNPVLYFDYRDNFMYAINSDRDKYIRYDMNLRTSTVIDLDDYGYLADWFEVTKDNVYVTVLNAQNSNREYVDVNFNDKTVTFLGTISEADRTVVEILPLN